MLDICRYAVSAGEAAGADEVEAMYSKEITTVVEAELGEVSKASSIRNEGLRIRVIADKALSSYFTYNIEKPAVKTAVEKAVAAARASKKDAQWDSLPSPGKYHSMNVWDSAMEGLGSEDLMKPVIETLQLLPDDISIPFAIHEMDFFDRACVNTSGIEHKDRGTIEVFGAMAVGKVESGVTPGFDKVTYQRKYNPDPQEIAEYLIEKINLFKNPETASSGKAPVIFSPLASEILLRFTLFKALSGENVARGKSLLAGKEGEQVAHPMFTLHDNGITPEGLASKEMDAEGVPCQDTPLIENGVLQGFIWNDYWAKRTWCTSTGNAHYDDRADEMLIQQSTMVVPPGEFTEEELLDVKDGYYVLNFQGAHGSNPESGDFSVVCTPAYRIRNGEISGGVVGMMLSDNVFSLLKKIDALGRDAEPQELSIFPHIRFSDVYIAAK